MARTSPTNRSKKRYATSEAILKATGDAINTGIGDAAGGVVEKAILGGRQGTGKVPFSRTPAGKKRKWQESHKGLAGNREF
jgi:hypothetical protein